MPAVVALTDSFVPSLPKGWNAAVRIKLADGTTDATVYADANGDATGANPLPLASAGFGRNYDGNGGWQCFLVPGDYVVSVTPHGGSEQHTSITVAAAATPVVRAVYEVYGTPSADVPVPTWNPDTGRLEFAAGGGGGGGGGSEQSVTVRKFDFTFDTPNLHTGAAIGYTPTVGDLLLDAWFEVTEAWDGTTPLGDFGFYIGGDNLGVFRDTGGCADMTSAEVSDGSDLPNGFQTAGLDASDVTRSQGLYQQAITQDAASARYLPAKFAVAQPLKVVVSTTGRTTGSDPGATQGAASLYIVTATPTTV